MKKRTLPAYEPHLAAKLLPMLPADELQELADDIAQHGLKEPIVLHKGQILDGRNRYEACRLADVAPRFQKWNGKDPVSFVLSANLHRRHLTPSQRALIASEAAEMLAFEAKERMLAGKNPGPNSDQGRAAGIAAAKMDVARSQVHLGDKVRESGARELVEAVRDGKVSVSDAAKVADQPKKLQVKLLELVESKQAKTLVAAAAGATRIPNDAYFTPDELALAIASEVGRLIVGLTAGRQPRAPKRILEPHSGGGSFVRAARVVFEKAEIHAIDISAPAEKLARDAGAQSFWCGDFLKYEGAEGFDLVIGNPPYDDAQPHVERAISLLRPGGMAAFLLRLSFLASMERKELNSGHGRYLTPIVPRPSFTPDGRTDGTEYGLFIWTKGLFDHVSLIGNPLVWKRERTAEAAS